VELTPTGGATLADALWTGPAATTADDSVSGVLQGVSDPNLIAGPITVHTTAGTAFSYSYYDADCKVVTGTRAQLWSSGISWDATADTSYALSARGSVTGSVLEATSVDITPRTTPCLVAGDY
jgi:hypothetical protein